MFTHCVDVFFLIVLRNLKIYSEYKFYQVHNLQIFLVVCGLNFNHSFSPFLILSLCCCFNLILFTSIYLMYVCSYV